MNLKEPYRLAIHLGVLDALSGEAGPLIRRLWADECPTGLIVSRNGGEWEHVLLGEIDTFEEDADEMLELGSENLFPNSPPDISTASDRSRFLSMEPLRNTLDWTVLSARLGSKFPARVPTEGLLPLIQYLNRMPASDPPTDFLPIALFFNEPNDEDGEDGIPCYVCKSDACKYYDCMLESSIPWDADITDMGWC